MKVCDAFITPESEYYIYTPSLLAREAYFYPLCTGHFTYKPGYSLYRTSYDSFLLLYILTGELTFTLQGQTHTASSGQFVLIDCYQPHAYTTDTGCECLWCHFDGLCARACCRNITEHLGNIFSLENPYPTVQKLQNIFNAFGCGRHIREPLISKYITDILTDFLLCTPENIKTPVDTDVIGTTLAYINEHFQEPLSVEALAEQAGFSQFHFIRTFKKETGFTPHEYLISIRLSTAKYLLKNTGMSVKDICFNTGFSSESVFCNCFKKHLGQTPASYRRQGAD